MLYNNISVIQKEKLTNFMAVKSLKEVLNKLFDDEEYLSMNNYIQHGNTNCILHLVAVTHYSLMLSSKLHIRVSYRSLVVGSLLHDYFLYDWHEKNEAHKWHGFRHPSFALKNALKKWKLNCIERNIIKTHMFPLTLFSIPKYRESIIVCLIDKICATYEIFARKNPYKKIRLLYKI